MRIVVINVFIIIFTLIASGEESVHSATYFLSKQYYNKYNWFTDISSSLHYLNINAGFYKLLPGTMELSYEGRIGKAYDNRKGMNEEHNLYIKTPGDHISFGVKASLDIGTRKYSTEENTWNYYPDGAEWVLYEKSTWRYEDLTSFKYGFDGNCRIGGSGNFATFMFGGKLIQQRGNHVEKDIVNKNKIEIQIDDYKPEDVSYEVKAGLLLSNEIQFVNMRYTGFAAFSGQFGHTCNPLRVSPELAEYKTRKTQTRILLHGENSKKWTGEFTIGFQPRNDLTFLKQMLHNGSDGQNRFVINNFKFSLHSTKENGVKYTYTFKTSDKNTLMDTMAYVTKSNFMSSTIVPEAFIINPISIQVPIDFRSEKINSVKYYTGFISGRLNCRMILSHDFYIDAVLSSGDLVANLDSHVGAFLPVFFYRAYSASIKIKFAKLF